MKPLKVDIEYYKKKYKSLYKKTIFFNTEILIGSLSTITSSTLSNVNPGVGIVILSSTALLTSIAFLITNENISKLKIRYTKLRNWINVTTLLYEKTLETSMVDEKEEEELKKDK